MAFFPILPLLALTLFGADYQLCLLLDGPNSGKIEVDRAKQLQSAHMQHIVEMWKSGSLESAGPISGAPKARGIFLFSASASEAARLGAVDPKVVAGDLRLSCHTWTAPAGIGKSYREASSRPGFAPQYTTNVGVLMKIVTPAPSFGQPRISGVLHGGDYHYFALFDTDQLAAVQAKFPDGLAFLWFHDARVWDGVTP